jgi:hypothetical protein
MFFDKRIVKPRAACSGEFHFVFNPAESKLHHASKGYGTFLSKLIDDQNKLKKVAIYGHLRANEDNTQILIRQ